MSKEKQLPIAHMQWHIDVQKLFNAKEFEVDQQGFNIL
jgi:hypothetical protein